MTNKKIGKGTLVLKEIKYDSGWIKTVMRSGKVGKVYTPKELIGKDVCIIPLNDDSKE